MTRGRPPVALIAGPTASGKSALALALANAAGGIVINADASQVYADLRLLSARPSAAEEARVPHRLFGHIDGAEPYSAARWAAEARDAIRDAQNSGSLPILVGGSGLYLRTLLDGIAPVPAIDPAVRAEVRGMDVAAAHAALAGQDPAAALRLAPSDTARVARALEVVRSTGRTLGDWQRAKAGGIGDAVRVIPAILLPPREWLYARCDARFAAMLEGGAIDEVAALLTRKLDPALPVMRAIGVAEIAHGLAGGIAWDRVKADAAMATRRYAKRQYTWFRHQLPIAWTRYETQLDDSMTNDIVIKMRERALTG